jgi:two-component system, NarL family, nitrate/nitrite response regulator NarL
MPKIFIVDDHAFIRRGVQGILRASPEWEVCGEADNGNDAIRLTKELAPDAIVMDVSMPGLNGLEATRAIRQNNQSVKIVLLTLHESSELVRNAFQAGVNGYLLKTDAEQELERALHVVLGQGKYVSPRIDSAVAKSLGAVPGQSNGVGQWGATGAPSTPRL